MIKKSCKKNEGFLSLFKELKHKNIIKYMDNFTENNDFYYVFEYFQVFFQKIIFIFKIKAFSYKGKSIDFEVNRIFERNDQIVSSYKELAIKWLKQIISSLVYLNKQNIQMNLKREYKFLIILVNLNRL